MTAKYLLKHLEPAPRAWIWAIFMDDPYWSPNPPEGCGPDVSSIIEKIYAHHESELSKAVLAVLDEIENTLGLSKDTDGRYVLPMNIGEKMDSKINEIRQRYTKEVI